MGLCCVRLGENDFTDVISDLVLILTLEDWFLAYRVVQIHRPESHRRLRNQFIPGGNCLPLLTLV